jgi:serine/threonine-protein kinase
MADVYAAVDTRLGRPVAVKMLRPAMAARPDVRRRFEDEARAAARLSHPNVVAVYDTGEDQGTPWIVMERLSGETLAQRMGDKPLDVDWVLRMAGDVLGALSAAHAAGIVHRDVKPGNILFTDEGCAKVADFGIAKSIESVSGDATTAGLLLGTPRFLSPERIDGRPTTASSDIYAVGVLLYEALSGQRAFDGDTPVSVAYAVQHTTPTPLAELRPDLPADVVAVVDRAMQRDPAARFATAKEMGAALDVLGLGVGAPRDEDPTVAVMAPAPEPTAMVELAGKKVELPKLLPVLLVAAFVLAVIGFLALSRGGGQGAPADGASASAQSPVSAELQSVAKRLAVGDGSRGAEGATRMQAIAAKLDGGDGSGAAADATALLRDAAQWRANRELGTTASDALIGAVSKVPGVDVAAATPPTTAAPAAFDGGKDKKKDKGKNQGEHDD